MTTIKATYRWTENELVTAQQYHTKIMGKRGRWVRFGLLIAMLTFLVYLYLWQDAFYWSLVVLAGIAYGGVIINEVSRHPEVIARKVKKRFADRPDKDKMLSFEIDTEDIETQTEGLASHKIGWQEIHKVVDTPTGFLFYLNRHVFIWLPQKAVGPNGTVKQLRRLIQERAPEYLNAAGQAE
ncbi:MAG: YcxB family protein [Ardenticatenaceae bacterium]|nr:YcxB family protein [Ardenticatenaceae bacterium]